MRAPIGILLAATVSAPVPALAAPDDHMHEPCVEAGHFELEVKAGTYRLPGEGRQSAGTIGVGYGVTPYWASTIMLGQEKAPGESSRFAGAIAENIFQLTERDRYAVDLGWLVEVGVPRESRYGYTLSTGPLVQKRVEAWTYNANVFFERTYGGEAVPAPERRTTVAYQAQALRALGEKLEIGLQAFGGVGPWNHWSATGKQSHRAGPTVQGEIAFGEHHALHYDVGYLVRLNRASPDHALRVLFTWAL